MKQKYFFYFIAFFILVCASCGGDEEEMKPIVNNNFSFDFPSECCQSTQVTYEVLNGVESDPSKYIYPTTAFSPNNDGLDDLFLVQSNSDVRNIKSLRIEDMDSTIIFELINFSPNDATFAWDGLNKDGALSYGAYKVLIEFRTMTNADVSMSYIVCSLDCNGSADYSASGFNAADCSWPSQHDGNGGRAPNIPANSCD